MGASAPDIITYIGVPLAVLGVTPIFWLAYRAILKKLKLLKDIKRYDLTDVSTRAELLSGSVEVTLKQYRLETLDRTEDGYWTHNFGRSPLEGNSWTVLNWREPHQTIRVVTCRLQYPDELRLLRAEVDFDSLVTFLLDTGAMLRPRETHSQRVLGFTSLRNHEIRTPVGTNILFGARDEPVLTVAAPFDNQHEGLPTLTIDRGGIWKLQGNRPQGNRLLPPPGWLLLRPLRLIEIKSSKKAGVIGIEPPSIKTNMEEEHSVKNMQLSEEKPIRSESVSSIKEENKISDMHDTSPAPEKARDTNAESSIGAQDISTQEEVDVETQKHFESILEIGRRGHMGASKSAFVVDDDNEIPLAYAAVLAWHWLIRAKVVGSNLNSAEVTEGLLNTMITKQEEAEYFTRCMDGWAHGKPITGLPEYGADLGGNAKHLKEVTDFAKATWLLCSMAKYLSRRDDFLDVEECFLSHPTILLG